MNKPSEKVQKILNELGDYNRQAPAPGKNYDDLPVCGPYKHEHQYTFLSGTYFGQYKDGKRHGFGKFVSIFI